MSARTLIVDGTDFQTIGFIGDRFPAAFDAAGRNFQEAQAHGRIGRVLTTVKPDVSSRSFTINGHIVASDAATADSNLHEIKYRLYNDSVLLRFSRDETLEYRARCVAIRASPLQPEMTQRAYDCSLQFLLIDPRTYAVSDSVVAFTTATDMPLGTAPTEPIIRLSGGTNPILIYRDSTGTEVARMEFTWSGTYIDIDMDRKTVIDNAAANQVSTLTTGEFFSLDPYDGDYPTSDWPTLEVNSGSGSATYRKAYW